MVRIRCVLLVGSAIFPTLVTAYVEFILIWAITIAASDGSYGRAAVFLMLALVPVFAGVTMWVRGRAFDAPLRTLFASLVAMFVALAVWFGAIFVFVVFVGPPY